MLPQLRVLDARTGRAVPLPERRGALLRLGVRLPCAGGEVGLTELRALVVADLLFRLAEAGGAQVELSVSRPELTADQAKALDRAPAALSAHPPGGPADQADVWVAPEGEVADAPLVVGVGPTRHRLPALPGLAEGEIDPLALRLALLGTRHADPLDLTRAQLDESARTLENWRSLVAQWAHTPSHPVPQDLRDRVRSAFADDLDTPAALAVLHGLETAEDPSPGARFEAFAEFDQVLAVDLTRGLAF